LIYGDPETPEQAYDERCLPRPTTPYSASKAAADLLSYQVTRAPGLDVVRARPFNHVGPRQSPKFAVAHFAEQLAAVELGRQPEPAPRPDRRPRHRPGVYSPDGARPHRRGVQRRHRPDAVDARGARPAAGAEFGEGGGAAAQRPGAQDGDAGGPRRRGQGPPGDRLGSAADAGADAGRHARLLAAGARRIAAGRGPRGGGPPGGGEHVRRRADRPGS